MKKMTKTIAVGAMLGAVSMGILTAGVATSPSVHVDASAVAVTPANRLGQLVIKKLDNYNRPVAGAQFDISYADGGFIKRVVTNRNGIVTVVLREGDYNITDLGALKAGEIAGTVMYYFSVKAFKTQTALFDKVHRTPGELPWWGIVR